MVRFFFVLASIFLISCTTEIEVNHAGNLRDVMQGKDISAHIDLKELEEIPNLYGVGALENLAGEILILNGNPVISNFKNALYVVDKSFDYKATLLVYSQVQDWASIVIPNSMNDLGGIIDFMDEISGPYGLKGKPFPFLIEGVAERADWHVVNGKAGGNHSESGVNGEIENDRVTIVGFYSKEHQGIFTHANSFIHAHVINEKQTMSGHLDYLLPGDDMVLKVPK